MDDNYHYTVPLTWLCDCSLDSWDGVELLLADDLGENLQRSHRLEGWLEERGQKQDSSVTQLELWSMAVKDLPLRVQLERLVYTRTSRPISE